MEDVVCAEEPAVQATQRLDIGPAFISTFGHLRQLVVHPVKILFRFVFLCGSFVWKDFSSFDSVLDHF